jgi:hypothetical protein
MQSRSSTELSNDTRHFARRLTQAAVLASVAALASAVPAQADYATCASLGGDQEAYCRSINHFIPDGIYWHYDAETDICTLYGC